MFYVTNKPASCLWCGRCTCCVTGKFKAEAAAAALRGIVPDMQSRGVVSTIPMPGHPIDQVPISTHIPRRCVTRVLFALVNGQTRLRSGQCYRRTYPTHSTALHALHCSTLSSLFYTLNFWTLSRFTHSTCSLQCSTPLRRSTSLLHTRCRSPYRALHTVCRSTLHNCTLCIVVYTLLLYTLSTATLSIDLHTLHRSTRITSSAASRDIP